MKASGHTAVMASRSEPPDSLDFFPTPPWATRALCEVVLPAQSLAKRSVWEPAAGEGHMAEVLAEYFQEIVASDVHDYGRGYAVGSFVGQGLDVMEINAPIGWVITNPPFNLAADFLERALNEATHGVALLVRLAWLEGGERYETIFRRWPPTAVAIFSERVPMTKGRWDPNASTATAYAWVVWEIEGPRGTRLMWIPPGQRQALERPGDRRRFAFVDDTQMLLPSLETQS